VILAIFRISGTIPVDIDSLNITVKTGDKILDAVLTKMFGTLVELRFPSNELKRDCTSDSDTGYITKIDTGELSTYMHGSSRQVPIEFANLGPTLIKCSLN
jgi:hypothetical protein